MQSRCRARRAVSGQCHPAELLQHSFEVAAAVCSQADVIRRSQQLPTGVRSASCAYRLGFYPRPQHQPQAGHSRSVLAQSGTARGWFRRQSTEQHDHQQLVWQRVTGDLLPCNNASTDGDWGRQLDQLRFFTTISRNRSAALPASSPLPAGRRVPARNQLCRRSVGARELGHVRMAVHHQSQTRTGNCQQLALHARPSHHQLWSGYSPHFPG